MKEVLKLVREDWQTFRSMLSIVGERQTIILMTLFGFWTALPWVTFQSKAYTVLNSYVKEDAIGWIMLIIGLCHAIAVLHSIDASSKVRNIGIYIRYGLLLLETMIWVAFAVSSSISYPPSLGFIAYGWYAFGSYCAFNKLHPDLHSLARRVT